MNASYEGMCFELERKTSHHWFFYSN